MGNVQDTLGIDFRTCEIDKSVIINTTNSPPSYIGSFLLAAKANASVAQKKKSSYQQMIEIDWKCKQELLWWNQNLELSSRKYLIQSPRQMIIQQML